MNEQATSSSTSTGLLVVICGPSGVGKTSIVREVKQRVDGIFSVSATTRARTAQDEEGVDYHFVSEHDFQGMIDRDEFLEHAQVFGRDWYGTPRPPIDRALADGNVVFLDIDVQGALQVHERCPEALLIFIMPPSEEALLARLRARGRDDEAAIQRRFAEAQREMSRSRESGAFDEFVVNSDLTAAQDRVHAIVEERRARVSER